MATTIDTKALRRALGQFPTGVTVITTLDNGGAPIGVTASSFNSVSMDPPLILWSIAKRAHSAAVFRDGEHFAVNVLGKHQVDLSNNFARQGHDKFAGIRCHDGLGGCPVLADTAACFECKTWNTYDGGDHIIVVGEVVRHRCSATVSPLVFARGSYSISVPQPASGALDAASFGQGSFLSQYLLYLLTRAHALYSAELYPLLMSECSVLPDEWRMLTMLATTESVTLEQLARLVMQPEDECRGCVERLAARNAVAVDGQGHVRLRSAGSALARRLFALAKTHEQTVLATLSHEQRQLLIASLVRLIAGFVQPSASGTTQSV